MPRARDPKREQARKLWEASGRTIKLRELAEKLQIPEKTISGWKAKDGWGKKNDQSTPNDERSVADNTPKRKRGAQPGHPPQGGAPKGSANAAITGAYMRIYGELLTVEERELVGDIIDQSSQRRLSLTQLLASLRVRERRLLKDINDIRAGANMLTRRTISHIEPTGTKDATGRERTKVVRINQEQEANRELIQRFEDALTRVQAEIRRTEDSLRQLDEAEAKNVYSHGQEANEIPKLFEVLSELQNDNE